MFEEKYNKYKYKYLSLKKLLNQKGQGKPPYKVLVFGGGDPELYGEGFYEVGNHPTSNFGAGRDWEKEPRFWSDLDEKLKDMTFDVIIFDDGSGSWLSEKCIDPILTIIATRLVQEGIFILEGPMIRGNSRIIDKIHEGIITGIGFNIIGRLGFGEIVDNQIYTIYSPHQGDILEFIDKTGINGNILPGTLDPRGFINPNPKFKYVIEPNQREFIKNRILPIYDAIL